MFSDLRVFVSLKNGGQTENDFLYLSQTTARQPDLGFVPFAWDPLSHDTPLSLSLSCTKRDLLQFEFFFSLRFTRFAAVWVWLLSVLGYGVAGDGFRCCRCLEVDGVWLILSLIFGFVQWVSVGFRSISVGVWLAVGCRLARGGLRGGSRWVCRVARGGGSHFWSIPVVLGVGFFFFVLF